MPKFDKPTWQIIKESLIELGGKASYEHLLAKVKEKYPRINVHTVYLHTRSCAVNRPVRVNFPRNKRERTCDRPFDCLFLASDGELEIYEPAKHGYWAIKRADGGKFVITQINETFEIKSDENALSSHVRYAEESALEEMQDEQNPSESESFETTFALESQLRDYLAYSIGSIHIDGMNMKLYSEFGQTGIEYSTDVGRIDILAITHMGEFVVFELKLNRGEEKALSQLQRYMGWVKKHLAKGANVKGVIVAQKRDCPPNCVSW